jgi:hypothetical protein
MKNKFCLVLPFLFSGLLLVGCSNDEFKEEVEKVKKENKQLSEEQQSAKDQKELEKFYKQFEKPINELLPNTQLDEVQVVEPTEVVKRDKYEDGNEFSNFVAQVLYQFYTLQISPEDYYTFLQKYGSENTLKNLPKNENAITALTTIQDMYKNQNINGDSYVLTKVVYDRFKTEGHFYRKVITTNGEEYFITTIVKEKNGWKYENDEPAPPYTEAAQDKETEASSY